MTTRQRLALLALLGGLLTVGGVVLYVLARDAGTNAPDLAAGPSAPSSAFAATESLRAAPAQPALPQRGDDSGGQASQPTSYKDYTIGGVRVRDHRPGDPKPLDLPPNVHRPQARELPSELTAAIGQQMRKVVWQCARDIPAAARGPKPKFEAQVTAGIDNHKLAIMEIASQVRDVEGQAVDAMRNCVARNAAGLTVSTAGQDDIANYGIRFSFVIP